MKHQNLIYLREFTVNNGAGKNEIDDFFFQKIVIYHLLNSDQSDNFLIPFLHDVNLSKTNVKYVCRKYDIDLDMFDAYYSAALIRFNLLCVDKFKYE